MTPDQQYLHDSVRTHSRETFVEVEAAHVSKATIASVFEHFVVVGEMMDHLKKNLFYGRKMPADWDDGLVEQFLTRGDDEYKLDHIDVDLLHAAIGIASEASEIIEAILKAMEIGEPIDEVNFSEELGDNQWYVALGLRAIKREFNHIFDQNINKLRARYPHKFTTTLALVRDTDAERKVLEQTQ